MICKAAYYHAYLLGETAGEIEMRADRIIDKNGHTLPHVRLEGGHLDLTSDALDVLNRAAAAKRQ